MRRGETWSRGESRIDERENERSRYERWTQRFGIRANKPET